MTDTVSQKRGNIPLLSDTVNVRAKLKVSVYSFDTIMAEVIFSNKGKNTIYLYKPLLPSDTLVENTFSVLDKNYKNLQHLTRLSNHRYLTDGTKGILQFIIPDASFKNLIEIRPNEDLAFSMNIAKHYDFRQAIKKTKSREVFIAYGNLFPYLIDGKQLYRPYTEMRGVNEERPLYFIVESKNVSGEFERLTISLPFK